MNLNKKITKLHKTLDKAIKKVRAKRRPTPNLSIWWIFAGIFVGSVFVLKFVMIFFKTLILRGGIKKWEK